MGAVVGPTYLLDLRCSRCRKVYPAGELQTYCLDCSAPLLARYDLEAARQNLDRDEIRFRPPGMWRWGELLPVYSCENIVTLGEGDLPTLPAVRLGKKLGLKALFIKEEGQNPTGTFKARGLAAAVSMAKELQVPGLVIPTAGNAGGALAAYAARAGLPAHIYMPEDTPRANVVECQVAGAQVTLVKGLISDAAVLAAEKSRSDGWFDVSTFKEPYRVEGKKIMGYELAETFGWHLPEVIIYPTGGGTGLVGMWKAFDELEALGWIPAGIRPRMVSVQAEGCAPVVAAFQAGAEFCEFWQGAETIASGLRVPKSFADREILACLRQSGGTAVAVSDQEILASQRELAEQEGIFAAPEGAATLTALEKLTAAGWVHPDERVVLFNTGSGIKYIG
jgi:threonine synthase